MRLLAVDTATQICGVALSENGVTRVTLALDTGRTHTRGIMDAVASVLRLGEVELDAIDGFAVTQGPGSFTGLRIGISTVKGLAAATGKPIVGISTLDVLANQVDLDGGLICPMLDARRGEVYWKLFRKEKADLIVLQPEQVGMATQAIEQISESCLFIGNGALAYQADLSNSFNLPSQWISEEGSQINPSTLAGLGWRKFKSGDAVDPASFAPVYIRRSDAEINFGAKSAPQA